LITWDKTEIPPEAFDRRLAKVRRVLAERRLPALAVYSELWRSNQARFLSNYMPYFNRALLLIPADQPPVLLCGLSPRVYGWIRSVTIIEDVRPAPKFDKALFQLASERNWTKLGVLDFDQFPYDMHQALRSGSLELVDVASDEVYSPQEDDVELAMRLKAREMTTEILEKELPKGVGMIDHHFVGRLERQFRRLGAEDLITLVSNGQTPPAPPTGAPLEENYSVSIAMEYRGHWVRITRPHGTAELLRDCRRALETGTLDSLVQENLGGSYPFECGAGPLPAHHLELNINGKRLFYGDAIL
jgi:hypothetical protein